MFTRKKMKMSSDFQQRQQLQFKVASTPLILKTITAHMTFSTLKAARLVCKDLKECADSELKMRKSCRASLNKLNVSKKLEILRDSDDLSWLELDCKSLQEENMEEFASACGPLVKMLSIYPCSTFWKLVKAGKFLNLEILTFCKDTTKNLLTGAAGSDSDSDFDSGDIFAALPNLQRIEGLNLLDASLVPAKILQFKSHLFKSAKSDKSRCYGNGSLNHVTLLAQAQPKLERLDIGKFQGVQEGPGFLEQLHLILESSRESLVEMAFPHSAYKYQVKFSQPFQRLSTFHIRIQSVSRSLINELVEMLAGFGGDDIVPNLKRVKFHFFPCYRNFPNILGFHPPKSCTTGKLSSVLNLELVNEHGFESAYDLVPSNWFPWISTLLPNVQNLTLGNWKDVDQILLCVFAGWPKLSSLKIHTFQHAENPRVGLDPVLTGLSLEKCEELYQHPENMTEDVLNCRKWPNLHSLKELKRLDFILGGGFSTPPFWCPVSRISLFYAVNLNPELKFTIRFPEDQHEYWKFLEPLSPYAKLEGTTGKICKFII